MLATFGAGLALAGRPGSPTGCTGGLSHLDERSIGPWLEGDAKRLPRRRRAPPGLLRARSEERFVVPLLLYSAGSLVQGPRDWTLPLPAPPRCGAAVRRRRGSSWTALVVVQWMAVPVPAGLSVQDVGYVLCLKALGVPDAPSGGHHLRGAEARQGPLLEPGRLAFVAFGEQGEITWRLAARTGRDREP